jgi:hypothetical protein
MTAIADIGRKLTLEDLVARLENREAHRLDVVVNARNMRAQDGNISVTGIQPRLDEEALAFVCPDGTYTLTGHAENALGDRLKVPARYLRYMRSEGELGLYDANINRWMEKSPARSFLLRTVETPDGERRIRAILSDRYQIVDDLDVLTATLDGINRTGIDVTVSSGDLTEQRMYVRMEAPAIQALAPDLMKGYRSPFSGQSGDELPVVFGGLELSNSEVGSGSFSLTPRLVVQVCSNGLTVNVDAFRKVHVGTRMEAGEVVASAATQKAARELITNRAADAVRHFLSPAYVETAVRKFEETAGKPVNDMHETVPAIVTKLGFGEAERKLVLEHFIQGQARTAGGLLHAMTSAAQQVEDAETAHNLEIKAAEAMSLV